MDITKHRFYDDDVQAVYSNDPYDGEKTIELDLTPLIDAVILNIDDVRALSIHFGLLPESAGKG